MAQQAAAEAAFSLQLINRSLLELMQLLLEQRQLVRVMIQPLIQLQQAVLRLPRPGLLELAVHPALHSQVQVVQGILLAVQKPAVGAAELAEMVQILLRTWLVVLVVLG
jgi:hypothetical protein